MLDASFVDGVIYCKLLREPRANIFGRSFDLINNQFHLLIASGKGLKGIKDISFRIKKQYLNFSTIWPFTDGNKLLQNKTKTNWKKKQHTDNSIDYHDIGRLASNAPRYLADVSVFGGASKLFLRLHAAFMITAWIGTASVGILLARYFKQTWVGSQLCGKDQWFAVSNFTST